jgi:hypothetical protein
MPTTPPPFGQYAPTAPGQLPGNITQTVPGNRNGAYVQSVDPNSLTSYRLGQLQRSDNPLVQNAAQAAQAYAAARGGGMSGAQAINASNAGMYQILAPVAEQDAGRFADVGDLNTQVLNQNQDTRMNNATQITSANIGAAAQRASVHERQHEFDTTQGNRAQDRAWALADQSTQAQANARSQLFGNMEQAIFSNPAVWRDPQGAAGMMNTYAQNFDSLFSQIFPEYDQNQAAAGQPQG